MPGKSGGCMIGYNDLFQVFFFFSQNDFVIFVKARYIQMRWIKHDVSIIKQRENLHAMNKLIHFMDENPDIFLSFEVLISLCDSKARRDYVK